MLQPKRIGQMLFLTVKSAFLEGVDLFKNYLVVSERINGLMALRVKPWKGEEHYIEFNDPAYVAYTTS